MSDNSQPRVCPQCAQHDKTRLVSEIVRTDTGTPLATTLAAPRSPGTANALGCATLFFSAMIAISVSIVIAAVTDFASTGPRGDLAFGVRETSAFTGVIAFMFVFVGVYGFFVWRQAQMDTRLRKAIFYWHRASERWQQLYHCARCDGVFIPGQPTLTPPAQVNTILYAEESAR